MGGGRGIVVYKLRLIGSWLCVCVRMKVVCVCLRENESSLCLRMGVACVFEWNESSSLCVCVSIELVGVYELE